MQNGPPNISSQQIPGSTAGTLSLAHDLEVATPGEFDTHAIKPRVREVVLKDIAVECLSVGDATQLGGLSLTIFGLTEENTGPMETVSSTRWSCPSVVRLHSGMDELVFVLQDSGVMGFVIFMKDELVALMERDSNTKLKCDVMMGEHFPSLTLTVTIGVIYAWMDQKLQQCSLLYLHNCPNNPNC